MFNSTAEQLTKSKFLAERSMRVKEIKEMEVINLISGVAGTEVNNIDGKTRFEDICGWDSLAWIKLSESLKQSFEYYDLIEDIEDISSVMDLIEKILK